VIKNHVTNLVSKTKGTQVILAKDSRTDFNIAVSKGISPSMNCSTCEKWSSISDPFETIGTNEARDWMGKGQRLAISNHWCKRHEKRLK